MKWYYWCALAILLLLLLSLAVWSRGGTKELPRPRLDRGIPTVNTVTLGNDPLDDPFPWIQTDDESSDISEMDLRGRSRAGSVSAMRARSGSAEAPILPTQGVRPRAETCGPISVRMTVPAEILTSAPQRESASTIARVMFPCMKPRSTCETLVHDADWGVINLVDEPPTVPTVLGVAASTQQLEQRLNTREVMLRRMCLNQAFLRPGADPTGQTRYRTEPGYGPA